MSRIARRIGDRRLLGIIRRFLQAGLMQDGVRRREQGTPQGEPLSLRTQKITLNLSGGCDFSGNQVHIDLCRMRLFVYDRHRLAWRRAAKPGDSLPGAIADPSPTAAKDAAVTEETQAVESELQSLRMAAVDEAKYLQLAESLAGFRSKLWVRAEALDIAVRQQILRLLVVQADLQCRLPVSLDQGRSQVYLLRAGVTSPVLANLLLDDLDQLLENRDIASAAMPATAISTCGRWRRGSA